MLVSCKMPTDDPAPAAKVTILGISYFAVNTPSDWWASTSSVKPGLTYSFGIKFEGSLTQADIVSAKVYLPNSAKYWTIDPDHFDQSANELYETGFRFDSYMYELPVGEMKMEVVLTDGSRLERLFTMGVPGHEANEGHSYVYNEDVVPTYPTASIQALYRPIITASSFTTSPISVTFTVNGPDVHNGWIWCYDAALNYIGCTSFFRDSVTGSCFSGLNGGSGFNISNGGSNTISLINTDLFDSNGNSVTPASFALIKKFRVVVTDGVQYESSSYTAFDYKAISALN